MERSLGTISLVVALHCEGVPFIEYYRLKRNNSIKHFQVYQRDDGISLIISGVGKINAAIATSYILSKVETAGGAAVINLGICGSGNPLYSIGTPVFVHQILDKDTGMEYFPDILFNHALHEGSLGTYSRIVEEKDIENIQTDLVDMECSGFFHAASKFLSPHQIYSVKVVSDHLAPAGLSPADVSRFMEGTLPQVTHLLDQIRQYCSEQCDILSMEEQEIVDALKGHLKLTVTQSHQLDAMVWNYKIRKGGILPSFDNVMRMGVKVKDERSKAFEILRGILSPS